MTSHAIEIGKLLRASVQGCIVGCRLSNLSTPAFGSLVRVPLDDKTSIYGLIYDIHIDDDGLVRQLVNAEGVTPEIVADNRVNRNVPAEISVLFVGYEAGGKVFHLLPPRPPLALDSIYTCSDSEICRFTAAGHFGYFRHILRSEDAPVGELLACHLQQGAQAHRMAGSPTWVEDATRELITLLRDDYATLISVLGALADADLGLAQ
jgi:hypothetical protein